MQHDAAWAERAQEELRALVNAWDPIGVFGPDADGDEAGPEDEYDCIRDRLISHLLQGAGREEITELLRAELTDHFGLDPELLTQEVIDQIFSWWSSAQ